jgi:hypothetical protein
MSTSDREPGWVIREQDFMGKCATCNRYVAGGADGLIRHVRKEHPAQVPKVTVVHESR